MGLGLYTLTPMMRWLGVSKLEKQFIRLQGKRDLFMQELMEELKGGLNKSLDEEKKKRNNLMEMLLSSSAKTGT